MGRFWIDYPYGIDNNVKTFSCKTCRNNKRNVQLTHMDNVMYWDVTGSVTGVLFDDAKHISIENTDRDGLFYKQGETVMFEPHMSGLRTTKYQRVHCKICKSHVGYSIPALDAILMFHVILI